MRGNRPGHVSTPERRRGGVGLRQPNAAPAGPHLRGWRGADGVNQPITTRLSSGWLSHLQEGHLYSAAGLRKGREACKTKSSISHPKESSDSLLSCASCRPCAGTKSKSKSGGLKNSAIPSTTPNTTRQKLSSRSW